MDWVQNKNYIHFVKKLFLPAQKASFEALENSHPVTLFLHPSAYKLKT
jgi:hypothetical protein